MRIATAGAYHNLVLWCLIALLGWYVLINQPDSRGINQIRRSGLGQFLSQGWTGWGTWFSPYKLIDDLGVSVRSIEQVFTARHRFHSGIDAA